MDRLRTLIDSCPGNTWSEKVSSFAVEANRTESRVYHWLSGNVPKRLSETLDGIEFNRMMKDYR